MKRRWTLSLAGTWGGLSMKSRQCVKFMTATWEWGPSLWGWTGLLVLPSWGAGKPEASYYFPYFVHLMHPEVIIQEVKTEVTSLVIYLFFLFFFPVFFESHCFSNGIWLWNECRFWGMVFLGGTHKEKMEDELIGLKKWSINTKIVSLPTILCASCDSLININIQPLHLLLINTSLRTF